MVQRAAAWGNMRQRESAGLCEESMCCAVVGICNMTTVRAGLRKRPESRQTTIISRMESGIGSGSVPLCL